MSGSAAVPGYGYGVPEPTPDLNWYKMNEGSGNTMTDSSGFALDGVNDVAAGNTEYVTGKSGSGFALHTLTAHSAPNIGHFSYVNRGIKTITICIWLKAATTQNADAMVCELTGNSFNNDSTWYWDYNGGDGTNVCQFHIRDGGGHLEKLLSQPTANVWHHWAVVFDNSTTLGNITIYLDGATTSPSTFSNSKNGNAAFVDASVYLGSRLQSALFWDGTMDDFRIYSYELTQAQVQAVMNDPQ